MRNSLSGIINLIIFVVLIFIAVFLYNGNNAGKANKEQSLFWQKTGEVFQHGLALVDSIGQSQNNTAGTADSNQDSWANISDKIKEEWDKSDSQTETSSVADYRDMFKWEKTATGAEFIYTEKNGEEHKFALPFKFLSQ